MARQRNILTLPDRFWNSIDNTIDGELLRTRGDALMYLLLELEKTKPDVISFEKIVHIPYSEYQNLKSELNSIKILQSKSSVRPWMTEKIIDELEATLDLKGKTENSALIALDEVKINKNLAVKYRPLKQENNELKKKLAELQPTAPQSVQ